METTKKKSYRKSNLLLIITGSIIELCFLVFTVFQKSERNIVLYMIVFGVSFLFYLIAQAIYKNNPEENSKYQWLNKLSRLTGLSPGVLIILLFAILFRITLIPTVPSTSDDVYRYIWEGKILLNGHNPFEVAPDDESLNYLHTKKYPGLVTYPHMTTIYPATAQAVFVLGYLISGESDKGLKLIYLIAEIITLIFIVKILRLRNQYENQVILYAWLPLPIMEFFVNSHVDAVGITFLMIFIYFILANKYLYSVIPFVLSFLTKLYPAMLFPLLIKQIGWKKSLNFGMLFALLAIVLMYPFIPAERSVNASLFTYLQNWSFNGSVYSLLSGILKNGYLAREICLILFLIGVIIVSVKFKDFLKGAYTIWILFVVFAATLYPWYLTWISAVNPFFGFYSVLSLFFTSNFTNLTPLGTVWREYWFVYLIEYVPFYFFLAIELMFLSKKFNKN